MLPPEGHPTILIVDDDAQSREWLAATLSVEGFDVVMAADGSEGVAQAAAAHPSLVLLAMELGDAQGLSVYRRICAISSAPVIMVTARHDELDAVVALEAGAADHIIKPPRPRELTARIRAVLRRVGSPSTSPVVEAPVGVYALGPVRIDVSLRQVVVRDQEAGNVVTRTQCMERIWRDRTKADSRTLDTHVKRLRKKIELTPAEPRHVLTVRGIGYRFKP
jgi:two-component system response regulator RegX3